MEMIRVIDTTKALAYFSGDGDLIDQLATIGCEYHVAKLTGESEQYVENLRRKFIVKLYFDVVEEA